MPNRTRRSALEFGLGSRTRGNPSPVGTVLSASGLNGRLVAHHVEAQDGGKDESSAFQPAPDRVFTNFSRKSRVTSFVTTGAQLCRLDSVSACRISGEDVVSKVL